jgi:hypothetical protein
MMQPLDGGCRIRRQLGQRSTVTSSRPVTPRWKRSSLPYHSRTEQTALKSMSPFPDPGDLVPASAPGALPESPAHRFSERRGVSLVIQQLTVAGGRQILEGRHHPWATGDTRQISQRLDPAANADAAAAGSPGNSESAARVEPRLALACADPLGLATLMMPAQVGPGPLRMWMSAHGAPSRRRPGLCQVNTSLPTVIHPDRKDGEVTSTGAGRVMAVML